jgi:hypothetical protein
VSDDEGLGERRGWVFWGSAAVGWAVVAFGLWTLLKRAGSTKPLNFTVLFIGLAVVHDLLFAPAVSLIGRVAGPRLSPAIRAIVFTAAVISGSLVLVALPPLLGDPADNMTLLPRNYAAGLLLSLAVVWATAGIVFGLRRFARMRT